MIRLLYSLLMTLAQPLVWLKLHQRGRREPGYLEAIGERFGRYSSRGSSRNYSANPPAFAAFSPSAAAVDWVWIHAVSLGETRAAAVLLAELRLQAPQLRLLLTHGTATGRAEGRALLREGDIQVWQPWDAPGPVNRFLNHFQPRVGVLIETEVWPSLTVACQKRELPLLMVNARLSEKSLFKAQRVAWLSRPTYRALSAVYAQTYADAQRLRQLGANVQGVFGNVKFDAQPSPSLLLQGKQWRAAWNAKQALTKPIVLFASSREGEEALLLDYLCTLPLAQRRAVQWLIVPRHPQRFDAVAALIKAQGFNISRRSVWGSNGPVDLLADDSNAINAANATGVSDMAPVLWLGDSLGEMPLYFALSDVALLGGSFLPFGGQNLIEAAACGCPVVMGPHTFNFAEAAANSASAGAAFAVADIPDAVVLAVDLLYKEKQLTNARLAASAFLMQHKGAAQKTAAVVARLV